MKMTILWILAAVVMLLWLLVILGNAAGAATINPKINPNWGLIQACEKHDVALVKEYLKVKGLDINYNDQTMTALTRAAGRNNVEIMRLLLDAGADINKGGENCPLLVTSRSHGCGAATKYLIERGADVNVRNPVGKTPLKLVCERLNMIKGWERDGMLEPDDTREMKELQEIEKLLIAKGAKE